MKVTTTPGYAASLRRQRCATAHGARGLWGQLSTSDAPLACFSWSASVYKAFRLLRVGQIATVFALALPVLLGACALATDVGVLYVDWVRLQKAADAAVLAGANYLPSNPGWAVDTANHYATLNGIAPGEIVSTQVAADQMSITMRLARPVPYYFARVLGLTRGGVSVRASAGVQAAGSGQGLLPIGIQYGTPLTTYQAVTLKQGPGSGYVAPGNWKPLAMGYNPSDDPGGSLYRNNIQYGYQSVIKINDLIYTEPGQLVGPTQQGITYRLDGGLNSDPSGTDTAHALNDLRIVEVPIVDFNGINGSSVVPVRGFAELWITGVSGSGDIYCEFIDQVTIGNKPSQGAPWYGALAVGLIG
jgi:Putative Flp pilus-assembly TadE/G-like